MKNSYTAAAAQFEPVSGNCAANMEKMLKLCDRAADAGASLIVFPELALTGYYLKADALRSLAVPAEGEWSRPLREKAAARQMMIAVGYPEREAAHAGAAREPSCAGAGRACFCLNLPPPPRWLFTFRPPLDPPTKTPFG